MITDKIKLTNSIDSIPMVSFTGGGIRQLADSINTYDTSDPNLGCKDDDRSSPRLTQPRVMGLLSFNKVRIYICV